MSTTGAPSSENNTLEERFTRYLYIGKEYPVYHPGNWFVHDYYTVDNVPSLLELARKPRLSTVPIELIKKALENKEYVQNLETLVFALAMCVRQSESETLRISAYQNVPLICNKPQHFILFVKFCKQLSLQKPEPKNGYGQGWRKAVYSWYHSKSPMELAICVTQCKGRYGWKHRDIIKLAHYRPCTPATAFIVKYLIFGLAKAKELEGLDEISDIVSYVENVELVKHCEDELEAAQLVKNNGLVLDHVPAHLLKSEEVWCSLIQTMDLITLLGNLQKIHNFGFLKSKSVFTQVINSLRSKNKIFESQIQPAFVYITLKNYENSGKPLTYEQRKAKSDAKKPTPTPNKPNPEIITTLYSTMSLSGMNLRRTKLRYVIAVNMVKQALDNPTWHNSNIRVVEAVAALADSLKYEECVTLVTFKSWGGHTERLSKSSSFTDILQQMEQLPVGIVSYDKPMNWAANKNKKVDIFINIVDQASAKLVKAEEGIISYRKKMKLPNAKLVICAMCASSTYLKEYDKNILYMCGFDANTPKVIEGFAMSLF